MRSGSYDYSAQAEQPTDGQSFKRMAYIFDIIVLLIFNV